MMRGCMVVLLVAASGVAGNFHDDAVGASMASWSSGCPEGWISVDHLGCLNFRVDAADSWAEAEDECDSIGGFLVEPNTKAKTETLTQLADLASGLEGVDSWWIGLSDSFHEGRWLWAHLVEDASFTNWAVGSPQEGPNLADCAMLRSDQGFTWSDTDCVNTRAAPLCQRHATTTTTTPTTMTTTPTTMTTTPTTMTTTPTTMTTTPTTMTTTPTTTTVADSVYECTAWISGDYGQYSFCGYNGELGCDNINCAYLPKGECDEACALIDATIPAIADQTENDEVSGICQDYKSSGDCWLGATKLGSSVADFKWDNGQAWTYTSETDPGQDNRREKCLIEYYDGVWDDFMCDASGTICLCRK